MSTGRSEQTEIPLNVRLQAIIVLLRPHQYYKNFLVFFGLFFSKNLFQTDLWLPVVLAFILLCLTSSFNYLINDFRDREKDRHHPEKCKRPFPSGTISSFLGLIIAIFLVTLILILLIILPPSFVFPYGAPDKLIEQGSISLPQKQHLFWY